MYLVILAWDLKESEQTVESLRGYLRDYAVEAFSQLDGMRLKAWFSNPDRQVWGAVYLWDSVEHMNAAQKTSRATELIGYPPTSVSCFGLEAVAEGRSAHQELADVGFAVEGVRGSGA